jgi:hypothetical protein
MSSFGPGTALLYTGGKPITEFPVEGVIESFVHESGHLIGHLWDGYRVFGDTLLYPFDQIGEWSSRNAFIDIEKLKRGEDATVEDCLAKTHWKGMIGDGCGSPGVVDCIDSFSQQEETQICLDKSSPYYKQLCQGGHFQCRRQWNEQCMSSTNLRQNGYPICKDGTFNCWLEVYCYEGAAYKEDMFRPTYSGLMNSPPLEEVAFYGAVGVYYIQQQLNRYDGNSSPVLHPVEVSPIFEGELLKFTVVASDADGDPLTLEDWNLSNLPGAEFEAGTTQIKEDGSSVVEGIFHWTPTQDQSDSYLVQFQVRDAEGVTGNLLVPIEVKDAIVVSIHLKPNHNLISLPGDPINKDVSSLVSNADEFIITYDNISNQFVLAKELEAGVGYFFYATTERDQKIFLKNLITEYTTDLGIGENGNLIGSVNGVAWLEPTSGSNALVRQVKTYENDVFKDVYQMEPGKGYSVVMDRPGQVRVATSILLPVKMIKLKLEDSLDEQGNRKFSEGIEMAAIAIVGGTVIPGSSSSKFFSGNRDLAQDNTLVVTGNGLKKIPYQIGGFLWTQKGFNLNDYQVTINGKIPPNVNRIFVDDRAEGIFTPDGNLEYTIQIQPKPVREIQVILDSYDLAEKPVYPEGINSFQLTLADNGQVLGTLLSTPALGNIQNTLKIQRNGLRKKPYTIVVSLGTKQGYEVTKYQVLVNGVSAVKSGASWKLDGYGVRKGEDILEYRIVVRYLSTQPSNAKL